MADETAETYEEPTDPTPEESYSPPPPAPPAAPAETYSAPAPAQPAWSQPSSAPSMTQPSGAAAKNPWVAGVLSFFPGMGNVYNGLYLRAVTFFLLIVLGIYLANVSNNPLFGFAVAFTWIFNVLDAYRQANLINDGYSEDPGTSLTRRGQASAREKLFAGGVLVVVGIIALLDRFFNIDLEWILELWPVVLVGVGIWLIVSALRSRRNESGEGAAPYYE